MTGLQKTRDLPSSHGILPDDGLQATLLDGVSRTFALTIPQLPDPLYKVVANAYLLCRIVDTIEDEISLSPSQKREYCLGFIEVVKRGADAEDFSKQLAPLLSTHTLPAEHELVRNISRVIEITRGFSEPQHDALACCVETMANGMPQFQVQGVKDGLKSMADMNLYCYYVAGCVGEMLAKLFCYYSPHIAANKALMLELAVSFGQGLQMTNILKDIWDDHERDVCWLPQDIFTEVGYDLANLTPHHNSSPFCKGLEHLISIAHDHLANALAFTLMIPKNEVGIRYFCLWALGMAVLTLRKIKTNLAFNKSEQVKISRRSVKAIVVISRFSGRQDKVLQRLFSHYGKELRVDQWDYKINPQPNF